MNTESLLSSAAETAEIIKIRYHGGSQRGKLREIAPISVNEGKVKARCLSSNVIKTFIIEKIEIVEFTDVGPHWEQDKVQVNTYQNLSAFLSNIMQTFNELGWHIESDLVGDEQSITLHKCFKNGKPRKNCDIALTYNKYSYEMIVDLESGHEELESTYQIAGERSRPWSVSAKNKSVRNFGSLDKATVIFIKWSRDYAPNK